MKTSSQQISIFTEDESTSSPVGFRVNLTQTQVSDLEKKMTDTSGLRCLEQYKKFNRHGLWERMFSDLLIGRMGWFSRKCRLTWRLRGTKYNRMYFLLQVSTLPTEEIESGLLPTVTTQEPLNQCELTETGRRKTKDGKSSHSLNLGRVVGMGLLKTPTAMDGEVSSGKKNPISGNSGTLAQELMSGYEPTMMKLGLLPTPKVGGEEGYETRAKRQGHKKAISHLEANIQWRQMNGLLPTPMAQSRATDEEKTLKRKEKYGGMKRAMYLENYLAMGMLPTPSAGNEKSGGTLTEWGGSGNKMRQIDGMNFQLNPRFVAEMMGFPPDWTELPFQNGEEKASKPTETQ